MPITMAALRRNRMVRELRNSAGLGPDGRSALEQRVDERRHRRDLADDQQAAEQQHHQDDGQQPVLLANAQEAPQLTDKRHLMLLRSIPAFSRAGPGTPLSWGSPTSHPHFCEAACGCRMTSAMRSATILVPVPL